MSDREKSIVFRKGSRIYLRPILRDDLDDLLRWINDEEVTRFLSAYLPVTEAEEEGWIDSLSNKENDIVFGIVLVESDRLIGTMGLHGINWKDRTATTGALIGEKDCWNQGYGTESKMLILDYAFNTLNLRKICSSVLEFNERSAAYLKKCGYSEEGRQKKQRYHDGRYWDEILMAVFKEDWLPVWEEYREEYL